MSAVSDFEKNVLHMPQQEIDALNAISDVIGAVSTVWGYVNVAKSILSSLGILPGSDTMTQLRQAVDQISAQFQAFLEALSKQITMLEVANQIGSARTALQLLLELAPDDAATPGIDPVWDAQRPTVEFATLQAVETLGIPSYWTRPFLPDLVYSQPWAKKGMNLDPDHTDSVFDWRWTLPAYLEVISIRLTILAATRRNLGDEGVKNELIGMANILAGYFQNIRDSVFTIPPPLNSMLDCDHDPVGILCWRQLGAPVGAVELYSTFSQVDSWSGRFPTSEDGNEYTRFMLRFFLRETKNFKRLFRIVGLDGAASTLIHLMLMAGISPATIDPPDTYYGVGPHITGAPLSGKDRAPASDWSLRELNQLISLWGVDPFASDLSGPPEGVVAHMPPGWRPLNFPH